MFRYSALSMFVWGFHIFKFSCDTVHVINLIIWVDLLDSLGCWLLQLAHGEAIVVSLFNGDHLIVILIVSQRCISEISTYHLIVGLWGWARGLPLDRDWSCSVVVSVSLLLDDEIMWLPHVTTWWTLWLDSQNLGLLLVWALTVCQRWPHMCSSASLEAYGWLLVALLYDILLGGVLRESIEDWASTSAISTGALCTSLSDLAALQYITATLLLFGVLFDLDEVGADSSICYSQHLALIALQFSFLYGLSIDVFTDSAAVHAAACVSLAYFRPIFLKLIPRMRYQLF